MSVQVVHKQPHRDYVNIVFIEHLLDQQPPIICSSPFRHHHVSSFSQRLHFHEYFCHAISDAFVVNGQLLSLFAGYRLADLTYQLLAGIIHVCQRIIGIIGQVVDSLSRTHCTIMCEIDGMKLSSIVLSTRRLTVHRWYLSAVSDKAKTICLASKTLSRITAPDGFSLGLRSRVASNLPSAKRFFRCPIVPLVMPSASTALATAHTGLIDPASQSNNARSQINVLALVFQHRSNLSSSLRSCSINVTRYRGGMSVFDGEKNIIFCFLFKNDDCNLNENPHSSS